jgi:ABC-type Mn2+/Zn2+ transport system permease subunit
MITLSEIYAEPFMRDALAATILTGAMLGYLGVFIILRRTVFLGAALPQFAACGVAVALFAGFAPLAGALGGALSGVAILSLIPSRGRIPPDGATGIAFALASAAAILVLAATAEGETHALQILSGDILGATSSETLVMAAVFGITAALHFAFWKELLFVSYDAEMARTLGLKTRIWDGLLFLTIGVCVAVSLRVAGAMVSFAFLVGPAAAALLLSRRLPVIVMLAALFGAFSGAAGLTLSFLYDLPSGPTIAACALVPVVPALTLMAIRRDCAHSGGPRARRVRSQVVGKPRVKRHMEHG